MDKIFDMLFNELGRALLDWIEFLYQELYYILWDLLVY